jgi:hypothetical protein
MRSVLLALALSLTGASAAEARVVIDAVLTAKPSHGRPEIFVFDHAVMLEVPEPSVFRLTLLSEAVTKWLGVFPVAPGGNVEASGFEADAAPFTVARRASASGFLYVASRSGFDRPLEARIIVEDLGPIPEPATWAMLIAGFGVAGATLRVRGRVRPETPRPAHCG